MPLPNNTSYCTGRRHGGQPCGNVAVRGRTVCRMHGGKTVSGVAHPNFKTGRYAKSLPQRLASRAEEYARDPRVLSLAPDVAVNQAHLAALFERLDTGESGETWRQLQQTFDGFSQALAKGDMDGMQAHFETMRRLVQHGGEQARTWREIQKAWEINCKLVATEVKTLATMQQMVTVQQMMLMLSRITDTVTRAVQTHADPKAGRAILMEVLTDFTEIATFGEKG
jgi:hypothetical protein